MPRKWIRADVDLPRYGVPVLVVWQGVVQKITYARDIGEWYSYEDREAMAPEDAFSHWMPLPEAPDA